MTKNLNALLTTAAVLAALAGASTLYAQSGPANPPSPGGGTMGGMMQGGQGDMAGMMNMMGQMSQMMESCNNMMKDMGQHRGPETQKEQKKPEQKR